MGSKRFSKEMLEELRKNPCIASVLSGCYVKFTPEFEKLACRELLKGEKTIHEILREHSIDPEMFGRNRIYSLAHRLRAKGESGCQSEIINVMKRRDLRNNPYVYSVMSDKIYFTDEFKNLVCQELLKGDKSMREIFEYFGFDTQLLGEARISQFALKMRKKCKQLQESQQGVKNVQNVYNVSQKERENIISSMGTNGSHHEECIKLLKQPQLLDAEAFESKVEANNISEINQETGTLQKAFTEKEREILLNNPYVANVTDYAIQFTEEFKELAYQEFIKTKKTMREILQEHGVNPEILGSKRIWNFTSKLQEKAKKLQGFGDARAHNRRRPKCSPTEEKTLTERIRSLEHELAYTRQEVEFLKKTQMVDMEARISWESKHRKK